MIILRIMEEALLILVRGDLSSRNLVEQRLCRNVKLGIYRLEGQA